MAKTTFLNLVNDNYDILINRNYPQYLEQLDTEL